MDSSDAKRIEEFKKKIGYNSQITKEDLIRALESAMGDRALYAWFIWKTLEKKLSKEEAESLMTEAMHDYGLYKSKGLGRVTNALEGMLNQSSRNGMYVFDQEFKALSEDYAEKHIKNCPLINAFKAVGASEEEIKTLCTRILAASDFAMLEPFADKVELSFPKTLSTDDVCIMCVRKKQEC